ncbi:hypothetical protein DFH09DRAFT_1130534 [Mycena vulgaris]|nr:hypothetical protein DFH09DRAFT_1130534 [Mycena vulgaris]
MKFTNSALAGSFAILSFLASVAQVNAICEGNFSVGITQDIRLGMGLGQWLVYDTQCNKIDGLVTTNNVCFEGIFGCSSKVSINTYTSTVTGPVLNCAEDPKSETCEDHPIAVCCGPNVLFSP